MVVTNSEESRILKQKKALNALIGVLSELWIFISASNSDFVGNIMFWKNLNLAVYPNVRKVWKCAPAARYLIYGVGQQGKGLLSAGHGYLQIINQGSFQKPGIVYLLFFCNPFQPCRESGVCFDALIILFDAE